MRDGALGPFLGAFGEALATRVPNLEERLAGFLADGLLEAEGERYVLTPEGRVLARSIAMVFDAWLESADGDSPRYSRTV